MVLDTIIGVVSLVFVLYIAYKSKATSVESEDDRQRLLTERLEGKKVIGEPTIVRIESVEFEGGRRGFVGWFRETYPGEVVLSFSFMNVLVAPSFLEQLGEEPAEFGEVIAEELGSRQLGHSTMTNWRVETNDPDEILDFIRGNVSAVDGALEEGQAYVQLTAEASIS